MVEVPGAELPTRQKISSCHLLPHIRLPIFCLPILGSLVTFHSFSSGSDRSGFHGSGLSSEAVRKGENPSIVLIVPVAHGNQRRATYDCLGSVIWAAMYGPRTSRITSIKISLEERKRGKGLGARGKKEERVQLVKESLYPGRDIFRAKFIDYGSPCPGLLAASVFPMEEDHVCNTLLLSRMSPSHFSEMIVQGTRWITVKRLALA